MMVEMTAKEAMDIGAKIAEDHIVCVNKILELNGGNFHQALEGNVVWLAAQIMKAMYEAEKRALS